MATMVPASVLADFRARRVLVTGGSGLIGRQVVRILCDAGAKVTIISLDSIKVHDAAEHVRGDLTDFGLCKTITVAQDYVFHIAGIKGSLEVTNSKPASFFVPLLMMNTNVLEACRLNRVGKVLYTSSIGAYPSGEVFREDAGLQGDPMDRYPGWAKRMAEMQIQAYRIQYGLDNFAIVRPCNVYGPGDNFDSQNAMVIPALMNRIYHGEDPLSVWGDGSAVRDFAYSEDVACGMIQAIHRGTGGGFVNLGSGRGYSIRELVETLSSFIPFQYKFDSAKSGGFPRRVMDISLAQRLLGYAPQTTLLEGLQKTWAWYLEHADEHQEKQNYFRESDRSPG